jgi:RHS repeat-associated protein
MRNRSCSIAFGALLATTALSAPALAQTAPSGPPPLHDTVDANGVDLISGQFRYSLTEAVLGAGEGAVSLMRFVGDGADRTNWSGGLYTASDGFVYAEFGGTADSFSCSGAICTSRTGNGATLVGNVYTASDGTRIEYRSGTRINDYPLQGFNCPNGTHRGDCAIPISITKPNGMKFTISWRIVEKCTVQAPNCEGGIGTGFYRFQGVTSSAGYSFDITYLTDNPGQFDAPQTDWYIKTGVTFANSVTACTSACPSLTYSTTGPFTITDGLGRQWKPGNSSIQRPGDTSPSTVATLGPNGVTSVTNYGVTTTYSRSVVGNVSTMTVTDALSNSQVVTGDIAKHRITSVKDELNNTTSYQHDASGRPTRVTLPEGNYTQLTYDARGNVTETRMVSKTPGTPADIVTTASYPATCTNSKTCNQPTSTKDPRGNQTDYTYDANHGGVLTITSPAPGAGAVRPKTSFGYTLTTPPVFGQPSIYLLTSTSACQTLDSCSGSADETRRTVAYAGNVLPTTVTASDGTGTLSASNVMTYDPAGNLLTVDGPLAGTADTTTFRYDAVRRQVGTISPDPDGGGPLKRRAVRITYRPDNQVSKQELGNVDGTTDADWAAMTVLQSLESFYDPNSRPSLTRQLGGTSRQAQTQYSYDALGRVQCTAVRMDRAQFTASASLDACSLGANTDPYDRITRLYYDAVGRPSKTLVGYQTADAAYEVQKTYSDNGQLIYLFDGNGNRTTYLYDGFDRLSQTRYPDPADGNGPSSTTDYEQLTYDAAFNVTNRRVRSGANIGFTYDALNRPTLKNLPGAEPDVSYSYDNLGRLTSASQTGNALSFTYDALSRNLTQVGPQGTVASEWDIAGRRTRLTYPDSGLFVNYDYLVTGETTRIRENGATSGVGALATYGYDDLGRRTSLTFGNGVVQSFSYDAVSRLASLSNQLSGTANDLAATFAYNPAAQIASTTRTGDSYAWTGHHNESLTGTPNGLNQLTTVGPKSLTHDANGNVTAFGAKSFTYSSENLLLTGPGATALSYDPQMRLWQIASGGSTTELAYEGVNRIGEYDGAGTLQRRYVFGPGIDNPIVWYEGSGTTNRRFLSSDERGSIVSATDSAGALLGINKYDEYGNPQASNLGVFGYTGQAWLASLNLWYYKARVYEPELGRFLQPDPIGYGGGMNVYAYTGNNPVNGIDSLGLDNEPNDPGNGLKPWVVCTGTRIRAACGDGGIADWASGFSSAGVGGQYAPGTGPNSGFFYCTNCGPSTAGANGDIVVTAPQYVWVSTSGSGSLSLTSILPFSTTQQANRTRSFCAAGVVGGVTEFILTAPIEGLLLTSTSAEVIAGGLAVAALPTLIIGGLVVGVVATLAVGTYYYDQTHQNSSANSLNRNFGICE